MAVQEKKTNKELFYGIQKMEAEKRGMFWREGISSKGNPFQVIEFREWDEKPAFYGTQLRPADAKRHLAAIEKHGMEAYKAHLEFLAQLAK